MDIRRLYKVKFNDSCMWYYFVARDLVHLEEKVNDYTKSNDMYYNHITKVEVVENGVAAW